MSQEITSARVASIAGRIQGLGVHGLLAQMRDDPDALVVDVLALAGSALTQAATVPAGDENE